MLAYALFANWLCNLIHREHILWVLWSIIDESVLVFSWVTWSAYHLSVSFSPCSCIYLNLAFLNRANISTTFYRSWQFRRRIKFSCTK
jgi:hypothetical protein